MIIIVIGCADYLCRYSLQPIILIIGPITRYSCYIGTTLGRSPRQGTRVGLYTADRLIRYYYYSRSSDVRCRPLYRNFV